MAFDIDVYISYAHLDNLPGTEDDHGWVTKFQRALEVRLSQLLGRQAVVHWERKLQGNDASGPVIDQLRRTAVLVTIVSSRSVASEWIRRELATFTEVANDRGDRTSGTPLFKVLKHAVPLAQQPRELQGVLGHEFFSVDPGTGKVREFDEFFGPAAEREFWLRLDDLAHEIVDHLQLVNPGHAPAAPSPAAVDRFPHGRETPPDRVLLGVSAPYASSPGSMFAARFVAYVEEFADVVERRLLALDGNADGSSHTVLGLTPDRAGGWLVGTPVTVRVSGAHLCVSPCQRSFEWNGRENLLSFLVTVDATAPPGNVGLCFEAFIEGVSVAFIPLTLTIADGTPVHELGMISEPVASTAFASYASSDASLVTACLSALKRWDPDLDIFMDCLDLTPNDEWQRELQRVIPTKDAFLLFWSVNASHSRWVEWELQHAKASKGVDWIRPMPIDDPSVAPPPEDLKHLHFGDRYLIAREAFLRRAEQAAGQ